jgi:hypothetical protein
MTFEEWKFTKCPAPHYPLNRTAERGMQLAWDAALEHNPAPAAPQYIILMCKNRADAGRPLDYGQGDEPFPEQLLARCHAKLFRTKEAAEEALQDTLEENGEMEYVKTHWFSIVPVA